MSASGKPAALSRRADGFRDRRRRARRVAGLDLDHLLVDLARELALGLRRHPRLACEHGGGKRQHQNGGVASKRD